MSHLHERERPLPAQSLHRLLFGDVPLAEWAAFHPSLATLPDLLASGDSAGAQTALAHFLDTPYLESRHYLQAWHALRGLGVAPPAGHAAHLYGAVLEVPQAPGHDTLAAYEDGTARYLNHAGGAVLWDGTDASVERLIRQLLAAGRQHLASSAIAPAPAPRDPVPPDVARISYLTPAGLRSIEGSVETIAGDPGSGPVYAAGAVLIQTLVRRARER